MAGLISILPLSANAASSTAQVRASDSVEYNVNVTTWRDIPFRSVVRQQYDFSCGSAAVATLLSYQFHRPTSEQDVFKVMWNAGDQQLIRKVGFSMFDMKSYLSSLGYDADGYRLSLDRLAELKTPAIALIQIGRYKHFVVIKGVHADRVLVGDPALGLLTIDRSKFQSIWNGLVFVIHKWPSGTPRPSFNVQAEWDPWATAPVAGSLPRWALEDLTVSYGQLYQITPSIVVDARNPLAGVP